MSDDPGVFSQRWSGGERVDPACLGDERTMLSQYLDYYRSTFELKCADLSAEQLNATTAGAAGALLHRK